MRVLNHTITAAAPIVRGRGTYLRILDAVDPLALEFVRDGQTIAYAVDVRAGFAHESRDENGALLAFDAVKITSATTQAIKVGVGFGAVQYDRSQGDVTVVGAVTVDGAPSAVRALAGTAYIGAHNLTAAAGNFARIQLWNPAASGVNAYVTKITHKPGATSDIVFLAKNQTQLAGGAAPWIGSKNLAAAAPACSVRYDGTGSTAGGFAVISATQEISFDGGERSLSDPIVVPPGWGLVTYPQTLAAQNVTSFQWHEVAV